MKRLITTAMFILLTALSANAADSKLNVLNSIQIDALKDTYNITLNTDTKVDVKRTVQSSNNMILTLKNIKPSKSLNTIYKNAVEVDSVMVEPVGDSALNITIQANNIANSAISVDSVETELDSVNNKSVLVPRKKKADKNKEEIVLSAPVTAYSPVYDESIDEEIDEPSFDMSGLSAIVVKLKNLLSQGNLSNIISTGLIGIILFCGIKLFKKEEPEAAVGLAQSLKDREMSLYKDIAKRSGVVGPMSLGRSQAQIAQNMSQSVASQVAKPSVSANAGYGLRAYQTSTKSPYMTSDIMKRPMASMQMSSKTPVTSAKPQVAPQPKNLSTVGSRVNNKMNLNINRPVQNATAPVTKASNIDSLKFLESMTQIYERNGRADLAQGLKAGMLKAKTSV